MTADPNPFEVLGLPARPDLTDDQVGAAWRAIAAATHPDRADGGDLARYTQAASAASPSCAPPGPGPRPGPTWASWARTTDWTRTASPADPLPAVHAPGPA